MCVCMRVCVRAYVHVHFGGEILTTVRDLGTYHIWAKIYVLVERMCVGAGVPSFVSDVVCGSWSVFLLMFSAGNHPL